MLTNSGSVSAVGSLAQPACLILSLGKDSPPSAPLGDQDLVSLQSGLRLEAGAGVQEFGDSSLKLWTPLQSPVSPQLLTPPHKRGQWGWGPVGSHQEPVGSHREPGSSWPGDQALTEPAARQHQGLCQALIR